MSAEPQRDRQGGAQELLEQLKAVCVCDRQPGRIVLLEPHQTALTADTPACIYCESAVMIQTLLTEGFNLVREHTIMRAERDQSRRDAASLSTDLVEAQQARTRLQQQCVVQKAHLERLVESIEIVKQAMASRASL